MPFPFDYKPYIGLTVKKNLPFVIAIPGVHMNKSRLNRPLSFEILFFVPLKIVCAHPNVTCCSINHNWVQQITFGSALTISGGSTNYMPSLLRRRSWSSRFCSSRTCATRWARSPLTSFRSSSSTKRTDLNCHKILSKNIWPFFKILFKLDIFEERLGNFNTWLNNNMTYVFRSFTESFSNFNLALNNLYMYKSNKKT